MDPVSEEARARAEQLRSCGFAHMTGVLVKDDKGNSHPIQAKPEDFGHWNIVETQLIIVTLDGEVWFRPEMIAGDQSCLANICPNGRKNDLDMHSPEETFLLYDYLDRRKDSYADHFSSTQAA